MAHGRDKRTQLRKLYVTDRQSLKAAAALMKLSYSTARAWKDDAKVHGDDWDHARMAEEIGDGGLRELTRMVLGEFVPLFRSTIEAIKTDKTCSAVDKAEALSRISDAYTKTVKASGAVDPQLAKLGWGMDVIKLLAQFTAERFPQHQAALLEILEPFGERLAQDYA